MMKIAFSWDDGAPEDRKLAELHERYELPGIFFVPTSNCEGRDVLSASDLRAFASNLVSIGGHTRSHHYLTQIPSDQVNGEIADNKAYLEDVLGQKINHFCLPGGKYNKNILETALSLYETTRTAETMCFKPQGHILRPSFHVYPRKYYDRCGNAVRHGAAGILMPLIQHPEWTNQIAEMVKFMLMYIDNHHCDAEMIIWGHSWEIDELGLWGQVEEIFREVKEHYSKQCVSFDELIPPSK